MSPADIIARFDGLRALVIGETMLDSYLGGGVGRLCREAPVPIVALADRVDALGAAANTAAGVRALGAAVDFLSVIGDDQPARDVRVQLDAQGLSGDAVLTAPARQTMVKQRVSGNGQLLCRLDSGSEGDVDEVTERRLLDLLGERWRDADVVIVSDYGYGVLTDAARDRIGELQRGDPKILVVDAKDLARWRVVRPTAVKPNYGETLSLIDAAPRHNGERVTQLLAAEARLFEATGAHIVAATLDASGAVIFEEGAPPYRTYTKAVADAQAAGAGDTFVGAFGLALAAGAHAPAAADLASVAASVSVAQGGTSVCTAAMLTEALPGASKLACAETVAARLAQWRAGGQRVVFTNGCFDILHRGHIGYLNHAKSLGDVLVIGLNSDASVRRLKGDSRPVNSQEDRAGVLAAMGAVDMVVLFDEPTPARLIEQIKPDLFVKGGDYTIETLPEAPLVMALGGEVKLLPFLEDRSTSAIIERIRASA